MNPGNIEGAFILFFVTFPIELKDLGQKKKDFFPLTYDNYQ